MKKAIKTENKKVKKINDDVAMLAKRLKELRIEKGYSNYEIFAFDNDLPRAQYGRYEKGEDLRFSSLMKVIRAYRISPKEFFSKGFGEIKSK